MKSLLTIPFLLILGVLSAQNSSISADELIHQALAALGTEYKINSIKNFELQGYGYRNLLEQSERYEGPYISTQFTFSLTLDLKDTIGLFNKDESIYTFKSKTQYLINNNQVVLKSQGRNIACPQNPLVLDDLQLNPLLIFQKALVSPKLRSLKDTVIHQVLHHRIHFLWGMFPVTISVNSNTYLPTMVEIEKPYTDNYLEVWGDIKKVTHYSFWDLFDNGIHYPRQKDIYFNGKLWESTLITDVTFNESLSRDSLTIPIEARKEIELISQNNRNNMQKMMDSKKEIAPSVWLIPGFCNSTIINQGNKIIIIESPNTSLNVEMIFDLAKQLFPKSIVDQVVTTSDAWLHVGGIRAAANRATVIALNENKEVIEALLHAHYKTEPDAWQANIKQSAYINYINKRTTVGTGVNRIELIPFRTEAGERMMMVYFPEHKLLYSSDLLQPGNWEKHYTYEVLAAIKRENLVVENIYAMHMQPIRYSELLKQMKAYLSN